MKARTLLAALRAALPARARAGGLSYFYNLDNGRDAGQVRRELLAMAGTGPVVIEGCESGGWMPKLPGYRLLHDTSSLSRRNVFAYVRDDQRLGPSRYVDRRRTWPRTQGAGTHEARSDLVYALGYTQRIVSHQPPRNAHNADQLQSEGFLLLAPVMAPWRHRGPWAKRTPASRLRGRRRPRTLAWDCNARAGDRYGPDVFAGLVDGDVTLGNRIDNLVTRNVRIEDAGLVSRVGGVRLLSDHGHAILYRWSVPAPWLPTVKPRKPRPRA